MMGVETNTGRLLERYLDLASYRQRLIAENIANIDTPSYRTQDIDFAVELKRAVTSENSPKPLPRDVDGLVQRPDGNDVDVDREGVLLAQTQLQYRVGVQLLKTEFHRMLTAINEGRQI